MLLEIHRDASRRLRALCVLLVVAAGCGDNALRELPGDAGTGGDAGDPGGQAPDTVITAGPSGVVSATAADFSFAAVPATAGAGFECAIDDAAFAPCQSPQHVDLAGGPHTFSVRALDAADRRDPTPATRRWTIDPSAPAIAIQAPQIPAVTSLVRPVVFFTVSDTSAVTVLCSVDVGPLAVCDGTAGFAAAADLAEGPHTYHVSALDNGGTGSTVDVAFTVDTTPPTVAITDGPPDTTGDPTQSFSFTISADASRVRCAIDTGEVIEPCTSPAVFPALQAGARVFTVTAFDDAEPANAASATRAFLLTGCGDGVVDPGEQCDSGALAGASCGSLGFDSGTLGCTSSCTFDTAGCGRCGDGIVNGSEQCDGGDLGGKTCEGLGHAAGTLACNASCGAFDATGCDGGFTADNTGFNGRVCIDGVKLGSTFAAVCTEDAGIWRQMLPDGALPAWTNMDGNTAGQQVMDLHGRAVIAPLDNPAVMFLVDNSAGANAYRSNLFSSTSQPMSWPVNNQITLATQGAPVELFAAKSGSSTNNLFGGWHAALGAVVLHGNANANAVASAIGPSVTGTVTSIATSAFALPSSDIYVAVLGQTPAGDPATGGIYWTCDLQGAAGGAFVERDTGIAAADKPLVGALLADPASFTSATRACPTSGDIVGGYATTYYAAVRGGGQIYKTTDGGETWIQSNVGLPAGASVFSLALDCSRVVAGFPNLCNNHELIYAATSAGLYRSTDAGATWALAGLEGKAARAVALPGDHPAGTAPRVMVGVDDAVGLYQRAP